MSQESGALLVNEASVRTDSGRALTVLYKEHATEAFRYALHLTGRRADAEDVVQHVFLQAHRHLESGRALVSPRAWLLTAVRHRALNVIRDRREISVDPATALVTAGASPRDEAEELAEVRGMLWTLPEHQHQAFVLRHWSGLSHAEIAEVLGTTPSAVESLLVRARSALVRSHESASAACSRVRRRLLDVSALAESDETHLETCRPCRHARTRLARAANLAGTLSLVPSAHVAHSLAELVPGFSAHAATSTAAAATGGVGAGAGAGAGAGSATAGVGATTAMTAAGKVAAVAKAAVAVAAATAVAGGVPAAHHAFSKLIARTASSVPAHRSGGGASAAASPQAPAEQTGAGAPATASGGSANGSLGKRLGAGKAPGKPADPGAGKPAHPGNGASPASGAVPGNGKGLGAGGNGKAVGKPAGAGGGKPTGTGGGKPTGAGGNGNAGGNAGGNGNANAGGNGTAGGNGNAGGNKPAGAGKP